MTNHIQIKKSVNMAEFSEKMPPYPDIFTDDFQMSDQVKYDILTKPWTFNFPVR